MSRYDRTCGLNGVRVRGKSKGAAMDSNRFDAMTKALARRMPRRRMLKGSAGVAAMAFAANNVRSTVAQDSGTTAKDRFISVRRYTTSSSVEEATQGLHGLIAV